MDVAGKKMMYTMDSEVGRMKLQSVKENLYEATTKVVLYSIEMYTKKDLTEWVRTDLPNKLDKVNNDLKRNEEELRQGYISKFDITNGCSVINDFVRGDALEQARLDLDAKIVLQEKKLSNIEEKERLLVERKKELETAAEADETEAETDSKEIDDFFGTQEENILEMEEDEEYDEDEAEEQEQYRPSELELFQERVSEISNQEEIANKLDELNEEKEFVQALKKELESLTKKGKGILKKQSEDERSNLENLRTLRNTVFAHKTEDELEISDIGSWQPEAGPLYQWAKEILNYLKIIETRYKYYALFDEFYAAKEGKEKFDACKVYVQRQINELYVNRSSIVFEFAGDLYDKEDEEYNFKKLIENMAINWNTGIRYLTVVTNEDIPELNVFFKECLSGTNKYVDYYLLDRNALRDACRKKALKDADYIYFRLLYHLNPSMEKIYWNNRSFTKKEYASQVIYKYIKVKNMFQFEARLNDCETYLAGIDVKKWSEQHLLSEVYFSCRDDEEGYALAKEMEDAIVDFCNNTRVGKAQRFRRAIKASVQLYFYMGQDYVFSYTRSNGQTVHWSTLEDASLYMENGNQFKSYGELCGFVDELYKSDYFRIWKRHLRNACKESGVQ